MITVLVSAYATWGSIAVATFWLGSYLYRSVKNTLEAGRDDVTAARLFVLPEAPSVPPALAKAG